MHQDCCSGGGSVSRLALVDAFLAQPSSRKFKYPALSLLVPRIGAQVGWAPSRAMRVDVCVGVCCRETGFPSLADSLRCSSPHPPALPSSHRPRRRLFARGPGFLSRLCWRRVIQHPSLAPRWSSCPPYCAMFARQGLISFPPPGSSPSPPPPPLSSTPGRCSPKCLLIHCLRLQAMEASAGFPPGHINTGGEYIPSLLPQVLCARLACGARVCVVCCLGNHWACLACV
jgi:hypothetical protein